MKISENIELIADVKSFARNPFTFIGSYPKVLVTEEGAPLVCDECYSDIESAYGDPWENEAEEF